jgi:uncharacterized protein YukE
MEELEIKQQKVTEILNKIISAMENINNSLKNILEGKNETDESAESV